MQKLLFTSVAIAAMLTPAIHYWDAIGTDTETHCVVEVIDQAPDGEWIVTEPVCSSSLADAVAIATRGSVVLKSAISGTELLAGKLDDALLASMTLGIHFDGANGTGSSISVAGGACTGGYWNTGAAWENRISSSWNGCPRLRHYDNPAMGGSFESTTGAGTTKNLGAMNNKTESVQYRAS